VRTAQAGEVADLTAGTEVGEITTSNPGQTHNGAPIGDSGRGWQMLYFDLSTTPRLPQHDGRTNKELQLPIYPRQGPWNRYQIPSAARLLQHDKKYAGEECLHVIVGQLAKNRDLSRKDEPYQKRSRRRQPNHRQ
jgi:hypothetical protein